MKLEEQFDKIIDGTGFTVVDNCTKIAEDFAIGFTEWCVKNELFYSIQYGRIETKSLLEIYKKEKEL